MARTENTETYSGWQGVELIRHKRLARLITLGKTLDNVRQCGLTIYILLLGSGNPVGKN